MSKELREAAERLSTGDGYADGPMRLQFILADGIKLADAYLAEHPADSELPITEEWLRSVGWSKEEHPDKWRFCRVDAMPIGLWCVDDGWKVMLIHHEHAQTCIVRGLKTRRSVRALCKVLEIPLKEPPNIPRTAE